MKGPNYFNPEGLTNGNILVVMLLNFNLLL